MPSFMATSRRKQRWVNNPDDIRYRMIEALMRSVPIVVLFMVISGVAQLHSNAVFDANEWHNLLEGGGGMAVAYALLRLRKIV